jgi:hypothetical protein
MKIRLAWVGLLVLMATTAQALASPNCTLPNTLTNGTTADANQVMGNFNAIIGAGCVGSAASAGANSDITSLNGLTSPVPTRGGFLNKFRNGTMDVWQRGTSVTATTSGGYTADGWIVVPSGASVTAQRASGGHLTVYSLQVTGASGITDVIVKQRIESFIAAPLTSQTATVQARVYNNTAGSITPLLTVKHAGSADNWSSPVIDVNAASLQSLANGQWTQIAYTFAASSSSANGLEISFDFGNNFGSSSNTIQITEVDIRATPGVSTGLNSNPPPPELRPVAAEIGFCQRYYAIGGSAGIPPFPSTSGNIGNLALVVTSSFALSAVNFPVAMRVSPTVTFATFNGTTGEVYDYTGASTVTLTGSGTSPYQILFLNFSGGTVGHGLGFQYQATAEL